MAARKVARTVVFLKVIVTDSAGRLVPDQGAVLRDIAALPLKTGPRHRTMQEGADALVLRVGRQPAGATNSELRGRFSKLKYVDLPLIADDQENHHAVPLRAGEGLDYISHFIWYDCSQIPRSATTLGGRPYGLAVWESSREGPSPAAFEKYLNEKAGPGLVVLVSLVLLDEFRSMIQQRGGVKSMHVTLGPSSSMLSRISPIQQWYGRAAPPSDDTIEITFREHGRTRYPAARALALMDAMSQDKDFRGVTADLGSGILVDMAAGVRSLRVNIALRGDDTKSISQVDAWRVLDGLFQQQKSAIGKVAG